MKNQVSQTVSGVMDYLECGVAHNVLYINQQCAGWILYIFH